MWLTVTEMLIKNSYGLVTPILDIIKEISSKGGGALGGREGSLLKQTCLSPTNPPSPIKHKTDLELVDYDTK